MYCDVFGGMVKEQESQFLNSCTDFLWDMLGRGRGRTKKPQLGTKICCTQSTRLGKHLLLQRWPLCFAVSVSLQIVVFSAIFVQQRFKLKIPTLDQQTDNRNNRRRYVGKQPMFRLQSILNLLNESSFGILFPFFFFNSQRAHK